MNIIPLEDRIIVRALKDATHQRGANVSPVPDMRSEQGVVIAAGAGRLDGEGLPVPLGVKAGDTVLFDHALADDVTIGGAMYLIMKAKDVRTVQAITATTAWRDASDRHRHDTRHVKQPLSGPHRIVVWGSS